MDYSSLVDYDKKNVRSKKDDKKEPAKKDSSNPKKDSSKRAGTRKRSRSRSPEIIVEIEEEIDYNVPNRQFGDLFCVVCDSHMNSEQMWENHIIGKRHLKNSRKGETAEQKYEYCTDAPTVQKELDKLSPLAGLDHICEILRINQPPIYQCFLCSASLTTSKLLMEHLTGLKHQMAFLKEHAKEEFALVDTSSLSKSYLGPILEDLISRYENNHGRGKMSVKREKGKPVSSYSYKKSNNDNTSKRPPKTPKEAPSKASKYSSPAPKSSRYSPANSSRYSPPNSSRYSPPPNLSRYSPPPKSARMKERQLESEWERVPVRERSREEYYLDRAYSDEEKWPRMEPEPTAYRREEPTYLGSYDSRFDQPNNYSNRWPSLDERNNTNDLRLILEQKKSLGSAMSSAKANVDVSPSLPVSNEITSISDKLLSLVNDMSSEVFLSLAVFKLSTLTVREQNDLKLLDRIAERATALASDFRKKSMLPDLQAKFQEALAENRLIAQDNTRVQQSSHSNLQFTQNLDNFLEHFKSRKATAYEEASPQVAYPSISKSSEQYLDNKLISHQQSNTSSYPNVPVRETTFDSEWNKKQSTALPFQSFSSTPSYIPGLEPDVPEESTPQPSSPLSQFAQAAKDIFGNINVPSTTANPYQNNDYNRLNYRY